MKKIITTALALYSIFFCGISTTEAQEAFILIQGQDTLTVERFLRQTDQVQGRLLVKKQQIPIVFDAKLDPDQSLEEISVAVFESGASMDAQPLQEGILKFRKDHIYAVTKQGGTVKKDTFQTQNKALTYHNSIPIISLLEQMVLRGKAIGKQEVSLPVFFMSGGGKTAEVGLKFSAQDSVKISIGNIQVDLKLNERGEILSGETSNGMHIQREKSLPDVAFATSPKDYSAPVNAPYTAENIIIHTAAGHNLAGTLTVPKNGSEPFPVVITITGSSPQDRDHNTPFGGKYNIYRHLADTLGRVGVAVLRMDDRGIGKSTGDFGTATTADRAEDIREGMKFVKQRNELDEEKIFLNGLSEGALIANMIAAENDDLAGIISMAGPASTGKEIMKYQLEESLSTVDSLSQAEKENMMQEKIAELEKQAKNDPWLNYFLDVDPLESAKEIREVPVLILQGATDKNVPPQDARELAKTIKANGNEDVTLKVFEDVNHIFLKDPNGHPQNYSDLESFDVVPQVYATIVEWIKERE